MQTVGAKRYFLSLAFSFRNSAKTFATKNAHAGTRGTRRSPSDVVVIEYVISTSFDGNEDSL